MKHILFVALGTILLSCNEKNTVNTEDVKKVIADTEKAFETMAKEKGVAEAFWYYADSTAVIWRSNDTLIQGKDNIRAFYSSDYYKSATVSWSADFIDVSACGDLAYSYGKYHWQSKDSTGKTTEAKGVFHTVWKKQKDGSWKYVWD